MVTPDMCVSALFRYPVKSMQGERLDSATVDTDGIVGDRHWGVVDLETDLVLTARRAPELLMARARLTRSDDAFVEIELPDGTVTTDDEALSAWLGRRVALRAADAETEGTYEIALGIDDEDTAPWVQWNGPRGSFHDSTTTKVSLVTAGSMRDWDVRRFRPNIVVTGDDGAEDGFVGQHLRIGTVTFDVCQQIDRCVMTTRRQPAHSGLPGLDRDLAVLKTINAERAAFLAIGMLVREAGTVTLGDRVDVVASSSAAP